MNILPAKALRRFQSMAWISPMGVIIPIEGDMMHSDVAETFPDVPADEPYPTNYALENLGYFKVGNAFDFAYDSDIPTRNVDRATQFDAMTQIVAQATLNFMKEGLPHWFHPPKEFEDDAFRWIVHMVDINDWKVRKISVKRFVAEHASQDTKDWFRIALREAIIRKRVRTILSEMLRKPV